MKTIAALVDEAGERERTPSHRRIIHAAHGPHRDRHVGFHFTKRGGVP
jgi:hypothetical protein